MEFDKSKYSTNISDLKDLAIQVKSIIADIYEAVSPPEIKSRKGIKRMVISDMEIIAIAILGELMTIDSERAWYSFCRKNLCAIFPVFCERSRFNRIRRNLHAVVGRCYEEFTALVSDSEEKMIDSMPHTGMQVRESTFPQDFSGLWRQLRQVHIQERNLPRVQAALAL